MDIASKLDSKTIGDIKTFIIIALVVLLFFKIVRFGYISNGEGFASVDRNFFVGDNVVKRNYTKTSKAKFYMRPDRYAVNNSEGNERCQSPFNTTDSRWNVNSAAGANGTCSDLMWHDMEPRAILFDNSSKCRNSTYNVPGGVITRN